MHRPSLVNPLLILAGSVILLAAMRFAASKVAPILFAFFIAALLIPVYRRLRSRMKNSLALLLSIGALVLVAIFLAWLIGYSIAAMTESLAYYEGAFSQRQDELQALVEENSGALGIEAVLSALNPANLIQILVFFLNTFSDLIKNGLLILFVAMFTLAEAPQFKSRMIRIFGADHALTRNTVATSDMIISYFGLRAIVNLIVAVGTALMYWLFGIPYAGLWGVLIFFLSFIPYLGAFLSAIPAVILAYAMGGLGLAVVIILLTIVINALTENLIQPLVMGKGLSVSPTVVFLSTVLWVYILGGLGAFVAMPLTLGLILFLGSFEETKNLVSMMVTMPLSSNKS